MLDGVVTFDIERYSHMPDRLARIASDLEEAARLLLGSGDPTGASAAGLLDQLAGWVRLQQARAADRWEQITSIPGFARFEEWQWEGSDGSFVWDLGWVTASDGAMHSYEELVALATFEATLRPLLARVEAGDPLEQGEVDAALAAIATIESPAVASALLDALGASGFRQLHHAIGATTDPTDPDDVARLEDGIGTLTALFASATRAVGRERLSDSFVDDFLGPPPDGPSGGEAVPAVGTAGTDQVDATQAAFAALAFGRDVAERLAALAGPRGALVVLERAGAPFAILTAGMPLVDLLQHGIGPEVAESTLTSGLGLAAFLTESAAVSVVLFSAAVIVSLVFATGDGGTPPGLVLSPDATNPGGHHYPQHVNEAGVPASPNGV